ncbi:MAG TPA: PilZ domain-containing protein [Candidatus Acidoferrales bacterium]|nr:PilZ domain-containing protein [Candidatus Acidoferrales bacterium]
MFKTLFRGHRAAVPPVKLPQINSFVDVVVGGRPARSVTVEACGPKGIVTRDALGRPGEIATLVYTTAAGRFRLQTKIVAASVSSTQFEYPRRVDTIGASTGVQKRSSVRLDTLVSGNWRFAPGGKGAGEFQRATIRDISRGGCALNVDRPLKLGTMVEVKILFGDAAPPIVLLAEVVRHQEIKSSGKHSHGVRFHGVRPEEDHAIIDFINKKLAELRSRGLA